MVSINMSNITGIFDNINNWSFGGQCGGCGACCAPLCDSAVASVAVRYDIMIILTSMFVVYIAITSILLKKKRISEDIFWKGYNGAMVGLLVSSLWLVNVVLFGWFGSNAGYIYYIVAAVIGAFIGYDIIKRQRWKELET